MSEALWAPWRAQYILAPKTDGCPFCELPAWNDDRAAYILRRGTYCFVMLNTYPYATAHLMIIPYTHTADLTSLPADAASEMMTLTQHSLRIIAEHLHPHGFNLGMNLGAVAGAGVADHLHLHVVPRWNGDTNFMPVLADTHVMPLSLSACDDLLREAFSAL